MELLVLPSVLYLSALLIGCSQSVSCTATITGISRILLTPDGNQNSLDVWITLLFKNSILIAIQSLDPFREILVRFIY